MAYTKIGSKFSRRYGKNLRELAAEFRVSMGVVSRWIKESNRNQRIVNVWHNIKSRCRNPKDPKFKHYGGRGILVKMKKLDLVYLWERDAADYMKQPSIDRINADAHYEISNSRFIEMEENRKRRR